MKRNCCTHLLCLLALAWFSLADASALTTPRHTDMNTTEDGHEYAPLQGVNK